jgi:hypothetical protein
MDLQHFVTEVIESIGGIVIPLEYALCNVIIPNEYSELFNGRNEFVLSFDFEVYQENESSEFVTFGSYILDRIFELSNKKALSTIRFAVIDRFELSNPLDRIKKTLGFSPSSNIEILNQRSVLYPWIVFNIRVLYISDERTEETVEIWVDGITHKVSENMALERSSIFYQTSHVYNFPLAKLPDISVGFKNAYLYVKENTFLKIENDTRKDELEKEIIRISEYYKDLNNENLKNMNRRGISNEHLKKLENKKDTLKLEKERQIKEMKEKYTIKPYITLDNGIIYLIPGIEYIISVSHRNEKHEKQIYYNPVLKKLILNP